MSEPLGRLETPSGATQSVDERLQAHPELRSRFEMILAIVENAAGEVETADEAERRVIEELRQLGNAVLHGWARPHHQKKAAEIAQQGGMSRKGNKSVYWYSLFGTIAVAEQLFRRGRGGPAVRPFSAAAQVRCRGYSHALQRAMTDFGADAPFAGAARKLQEHYGIAVPISAVRATTQHHGARLRASAPPEPARPERPGVAQLIVEIDGSLIPVVETGGEGADRRKTRQLDWKEARLCLAHAPGSVTPSFGATLGSVDDAGAAMLGCAVRAGAGTATKVHGLGDGAPWIPEQVERCFGTQARYLVDCAHLCDYLAGAAEPIAAANKEAWTAAQKERMKANEWPAVLQTRAPFVEGDRVADENAPVRRCHRYIANRPNFLDYRGALAAGLPIGSGEVESAHRYVIQARLKIAGAWWKLDNAEKMLALRVARANGDWARSWDTPALKAA